MSKTPIMVLQEVMTKQGSLPCYELVRANAGTHINTFTFQVKCNDVTAEGTASTKQGAKQIAAKEMLHKLKEVMNIPELSLISSAMSDNSVVSLKLPELHSCISTTSTPFVNAVGKLQEYCIQYKFPNPQYDIIDVTGSSPKAVFTVICVVSTVREEASAYNKKHAKQEVAKKVLDRLIDIKSKSKDDMQDIDVMEVTLKEPVWSDNIEQKVHKVKYLELKKLPFTTTDNITISNFHMCMKYIHSLEKCKTITEKLKELMFNVEKHSETALFDLKNGLQSVSMILKAEITRIKFVVKGPFIVIGFRLNLKPNIIQVGFGDTESMAETLAIKETMRCLILLLE